MIRNEDEQQGLAVFLIFLVVASLLCTFTTGGGRAYSNIFSNLFSNYEYAPSPDVEAQLEPFKQPLGTYWLIGSIAAIVALVTLCGIGIYILTRRRVPRSWCLFLVALGIVLILLLWMSSQQQTAISAIPMPRPPVGSASYEGLVAGFNTLTVLAEFGGIMILVGGGLFIWSLMRREN